ncbi:potassium channel family protein [Streptomyces sp. LHD-70]|uniref:potassium channel family protein n=1 Tax=Streptomyces sp. LHD-70 TaxID=3072140 RepID=UPI00280EBC21|nr:potassium channel family protein [Streptomyces sp. LHD-70]MDQ8705350.1 potassium channel family protein [Streptomyces sp. LHD-70]
MTTAYFQLPLDRLGPQRPVLSWTLLTVALAIVALLLLRQTSDVLTNRPGSRPLIVIPLLMCLSVLVFAGCSYVLAAQPGEFSGLGTRVDALYFTLVTLATIGYGDITATGQSARVVTILQILYTFVFLTAAALGRRVRGTVVRRHRRPEAGSGAAPGRGGED